MAFLSTPIKILRLQAPVLDFSNQLYKANPSYGLLSLV
jgi:hypothetical protein